MNRLLKRLELNGFKSFASRTIFDFSQGVTAIVGPNGSGKSNVIDGIRWLLGEREAKNLRGGKGEDLIFAGTPKKPRLGQASASLYFENVDNFFPVDFPEITVSRQVNRDGSNQYFLNKSEVRLKDLIDFFAKARLGAKGLTVISQGNSDVFIQSTSAGRREMIEEMLGLREYQLKKTSAEKMLKNTQINLDKVRALTEEILPHLRSLKRQTNRWEKREQLEEELKGLENQFFGAEFKEIEEKTKRALGEISRHAVNLGVLKDEKEKAEGNLKRVESSQPEGRRELEVIKKETQGLLENRGLLQKELGRLEGQLQVFEKTLDTTLPSANTLAKFLKELRGKLRKCITEPGKAEKLINEIIEEIDILLQAPQSRPEEGSKTELKTEFEKIKEDLNKLEEQMLSLKEKEQNLERGQESFYHEFKKANAAVETAKDKIEKWESENQQLLFQKERMEIARYEWERQVRQAERTPNEFEKIELDPVPAYDKDTMDKKILRLRGELASMGEIDENLVKEARDTEERYTFLNKEADDLEKAKEDLKRIISDLSEKIKTEFGGALVKINEEFDKFFGLMFGGGHAKLKVENKRIEKKKDEEDLPEGGEIKDAVKIEEAEEEKEEGLEIDVKMPRKKITSLEMLSGGERSLVGIAALFALISVSPPPFLVLDEIDAALDERNARRFSELLKEFALKTQFILVTHNRATMEVADILYGITMNDDGTSKVISLKIESQVEEGKKKA